LNVEHSLLAYLDTPVIIGDPDGRAVYFNPAFEKRFSVQGDLAIGRPLAELFEGGGREAVLAGVARACEVGETARFQVREDGVGYSAVASPIVAGTEKVGVVVLLQQEIEGVERLVTLHREMCRPMEDLTAALQELFEQTGGRRAAQYRSLVEDGLRALDRVRKGVDDIASLLKGVPGAGPGRFDPAAVLRQVMEKVRSGAPESVHTFLLAPSSLPTAEGDPDRLEWALNEMVSRRLAREPAPTRLALGARSVNGSQGPWTLISVSESFDAGTQAPPASDPPEVTDTLSELGVELHVVSDPRLGRTTLLRLAAGG